MTNIAPIAPPDWWIGAVVGKKIVGVVVVLYLCGLIGEMCAQLFCISRMGAN